MFFVLSKIFSFLISPFTWLLIWVILFMLIKNPKWKKRFKWIAISWFLFFSNPYIIHQLNLKWQMPARELKQGEVYDAGIVLGGFVQFNDKEKKGYFGAASDRFLQAVRLYKLGHIKKILVTGGSGNLMHQEYKEASFAREQLLQFGIPAQDILIENESRNTFENAVLSKKIADSAGIQPPFLLITSAMHMRRAEKVFSKAGLPVVDFPSNFTEMDFPMSFTGAIIPSFNAMNEWDNLLKEAIGLQVYKWTGKA
ncbi:MAG: YdcF family protein [Sphingobacteriales bacterium]|nr:MAG: YdcF family protein [Sphingobacteriales bacterium]